MIGRLEVRLLNYFLLIAIAAVMIGVEFYFEMDRPDLAQEICTVIEQPASQGYSDQAIPQTSSALEKLRNKIVTMFGVLTLVVAIVLMMFIKNITRPLCKMAEVAERINHGDLSQIVEIESKDEIGQLGIAINELTSNLQEVASFTSSTSGEAIRKLNTMIEQIKDGKKPSPAEVEAIKSDIESLIEFSDSFELLKTETST